MKKINTVRSSRDFQRIIKSNKPYKYKDYIIYVEKSIDNYHFGLSVGTKIGNAVVRNKIRRQLKSIIDKKTYKKDFNCIIIVGKGILNRSFIDMEQYLFKCFEDLKLIEEK